MTPDEPQRQGETQRTRRLKFGANVVVAAVAALALVVLLNALVAYQIKRVPPDLRRYVRYDLTATREYSLSDQTIAVLKGLEQPHEIVTLFGPVELETDAGRARSIQRAEDLLGEYARYSKQVSVEHIRYGAGTATELTRLHELFESLRRRFDPQLAPLVQAIQQGHEALERFSQQAPDLGEDLGTLLAESDLTPEVREAAQFLAQEIQRLGHQREAVERAIEQELAKPLPDYAALSSSLRRGLEDLAESKLPAVTERFRRAAQAQRTRDNVKEQLLSLLERIRTAQEAMERTLDAMREVPPLEEYDTLRQQLSGADAIDTIIVRGPESQRVVRLADMFRRPELERAAPEEEHVEPMFLGEEIVTGALASLQVKQPPLAVFVYGGRQPALGRGGAFEHVAQRLRRLNFQVEQWSPGPSMGPMGQMEPPRPMPTPQTGQRAVWIVTPGEPPNPMNPMSFGGAEAVLRAVEDRLAAGDAALLMLTPNEMARFGTDPAAQLLEAWSIRPQLDKVVLREMAVPRQGVQSSPMHPVDQWPSDLPITRALGRSGGLFLQAIPLELDSTEGKQVTLHPLVRLEHERLWAAPAAEATSVGAGQYNPDAAARSFVIAAAAESAANRLIVVGDPFWASDHITTNADPFLRLPGLAEYAGAAYPANAELFINSVLWLAGQEQLIAASARTQDLRRVGPMSVGGYRALQWSLLLAPPALTLAAGLGVWAARRRG